MKEIEKIEDRTAVVPATEMSKDELIAAYEALFRSTVQPNDNDNDTYSLAQPSPYRFVPSMLSGNSKTLE